MADVYIPVFVRRLVTSRANDHCEYCLLSADLTGLGCHIDHIISLKHNGTSDPDNLAIACAQCNRAKGSDLSAIDPQTGQVTQVFHPRRDHWSDHFFLSGSQILGVTAKGRATVELLRLNSMERIKERREFIKARLYPSVIALARMSRRPAPDNPSS